MATARSRTNSTSSNSSVGSDNADIHTRSTKNLLDQGNKNKNIVQRTRDALGDIGNRMKKNGNNVGNTGTGKPAFVIGKPALGLQNTGSFAVPLAPAPKAVRKDANANAAKKAPIFRSNSVTGTQQAQVNPVPSVAVANNKPKVVKAKVCSNLHRSRSFQQKDANGTADSKENNPVIDALPLAENSKVNQNIVSKDKAEESEVAVPENIVSQIESSLKLINVQQENTTKVDDSSDVKQLSETNVAVKEESKNESALLRLDGYLADSGFSKRFGVVDIDSNDEGNYFLVTNYIVDICDYLFDLEKRYPIRIRYLEGRLVNSRMRAVLMDWLVEVHNQFKFAPETLYIATKTMDRFLLIDRNISRKQLQLVGVTAMYIAAKFEEVCTPTVLDFAAVSDNAFSSHDVIKMEETMLRALGYDLAPPPACFFLRRFSKAASSSMQLHGLAKYIMELSLVDYAACHLYPSQQAYGALSLAMLVLEKRPLADMWDATMQHYSKTTLQIIAPIITIMSGVLSRAHEEPTKLQAVTNKYAKTRASRVSKLPELNVDEWKGRVAKELLKYK